MKALVRISETTATPLAPDMLDVAGLLLGAGRGQPPAHKLTLIDAAIILLDRARADLVPPEEIAPRERRQVRTARRAAPAKQQTGRRPSAAEHREGPARQTTRPEPSAPAPAAAATPRAEPRGGGQADKSTTANGVTVTFGDDGGEIVHAGGSFFCNVKQARLVACLAKAMPNPVGRDFIAKKMWAGVRVPDAYETIISNIMSPIIAPLGAIGLTLKTVRGVGLALQKAGE